MPQYQPESQAESAARRSPAPAPKHQRIDVDREWHAGELETSMVLAAAPGLVRRAAMRRLRPVWVDFREKLRRGARRFEDLDPKRRGYFGSPSVARAQTGARAMALRARLIAREVTTALRASPRS